MYDADDMQCCCCGGVEFVCSNGYGEGLWNRETLILYTLILDTLCRQYSTVSWDNKDIGQTGHNGVVGEVGLVQAKML